MYIQYSWTQEKAMTTHIRQHYQPRPERLPNWLRRIWAWL